MMIRFPAALCFLVAAVPCLGAPLAELQTAACAFHDILEADYQQCRAGGHCYGDIGALARNGGNSSKFFKVCEFRVSDLIGYCAARNTRAARTALNSAIAAAENWIGQTEKYCWDGQMDCNYVVSRFGAGYVTIGDVTWGRSYDTAKRHVWAVAAAVGAQSKVDPSAVSILAELYNRSDQADVCR
jgi:hypothetical protein